MGRKREQPDPNARVIEDPSYPGCYFVRVEGTDQSYVDLADPTHLEFDYIQRMADVVDACFPRPERLRVAHVGGAGMTLPRWISVTRPTSAQRVFDPDADLIDEVRRVAPLPPRSGIKVRTEEGRTCVGELPSGQLDLLVVDAYAGGRVPPLLSTREFFALAAERLSNPGVFLMNLSDAAPFHYAKRVCAAACANWKDAFIAAEAGILRGRRFGNLLLVASSSPLPVSDLVRHWAGGVFPYRLEDLSGERRSWLGGASPWTDDDSSWSHSFAVTFRS